MKRTSTAHWEGTGKEGKGHLSSPSGVLNMDTYTWASRFADENATNPEELIAAAHAGCISMKLSFILVAAGYVPSTIDTSCTITIENGTITHSDLHIRANVPGMEDEAFAKCAEEAKLTCPVSKALNMEISLRAMLV